jgi:hypothetical protein
MADDELLPTLMLVNDWPMFRSSSTGLTTALVCLSEVKVGMNLRYLLPPPRS